MAIFGAVPLYHFVHRGQCTYAIQVCVRVSAEASTPVAIRRLCSTVEVHGGVSSADIAYIAPVHMPLDLYCKQVSFVTENRPQSSVRPQILLHVSVVMGGPPPASGSALSVLHAGVAKMTYGSWPIVAMASILNMPYCDVSEFWYTLTNIAL